MEIIDHGFPSITTGHTTMCDRQVIIEVLDHPVLQYSRTFGCCHTMYFVVIELESLKQTAWLWDGYLMEG